MQQHITIVSPENYVVELNKKAKVLKEPTLLIPSHNLDCLQYKTNIKAVLKTGAFTFHQENQLLAQRS
jgi:hypothetical protein